MLISGFMDFKCIYRKQFAFLHYILFMNAWSLLASSSVFYIQVDEVDILS